MKDKITKIADDTYKWICQQTDDQQERIDLAKKIIKGMERENALKDLLDSKDLKN